MSALVNMDGIRRNLNWWEWVVEHGSFGLKDVPISLTSSITTLPAIDGGDVEWAMDVGVRMSKVEKPMERKKFVALGICGRGVRWANKVCIQRRTWPRQIIAIMVLNPKTPVNSIAPEFSKMRDVKVNSITTIIKTRWVG